MRGIPLVITESVEKQLFQGYDDGILSVLKMLGNFADPAVLEAISDVFSFVSILHNNYFFSHLFVNMPSTFNFFSIQAKSLFSSVSIETSSRK